MQPCQQVMLTRWIYFVHSKLAKHYAAVIKCPTRQCSIPCAPMYVTFSATRQTQGTDRRNTCMQCLDWNLKHNAHNGLGNRLGLILPRFWTLWRKTLPSTSFLGHGKAIKSKYPGIFKWLLLFSGSSNGSSVDTRSCMQDLDSSDGHGVRLNEISSPSFVIFHIDNPMCICTPKRLRINLPSQGCFQIPILSRNCGGYPTRLGSTHNVLWIRHQNICTAAVLTNVDDLWSLAGW